VDKLKAEGPQILRWMIEGCLEWQRVGLGVPPTVREASGDYFHSQDSVAHWLDDCAERKQLAFTLTRDLFPSWKAWAEERGIDAGSAKAFAMGLQERGWTYKKTKDGGGFKDLALKPKPTAQTDEPLEAAPEEPEIEL
jgi:putative DNA primase/helicase